MSVTTGTLSYKKQWLASKRSDTQQVCEVYPKEVRLEAAGQKKIAFCEISRGAVCHRTASENVQLY